MSAQGNALGMQPDVRCARPERAKPSRETESLPIIALAELGNEMKEK